MNQLDSDLHLPLRKRFLAGFKKLNSNVNGSSSSSSSSSSSYSHSPSSTSNSNVSSSASTNVQTHLDSLLASRFTNNNDQNQSPEELVEATRSAAALAVKAAKAARAMANEKALISSKAIGVAKRALEFVDSFLKEETSAVVDSKELLYSKRQLRDEEEDLARRLQRAIDNKYPRILRTYSGFEENSQRNKKQKKNKTEVEGGSSSIVTGSMNDIAGVLDSDSSYGGLESNGKVSVAKAMEESNSLCKRRGRVKLKKLPLSISNSINQENGASSASPLPVAQPPEETPVVVSASSSWKCQDLKPPECVKQNKAVRS